MKHVKLFEEFTSSINEEFKLGDLVRWSNPRNQTGLPALYGSIAKDRGKKVDIKIIGTGSNSTFQPEYGPNRTPWKKEYLSQIDQLLANTSPGEGYDKKHLTNWNL